MHSCRIGLRTRVLAVLGASALILTFTHSAAVSFPAMEASAVFTECADGIDNDGDRQFDYPQDPQCLSLHDNSEGPTGRGLFVELSDGLDTVKPGGSLVYTVNLRTERAMFQAVDVYFQVPHQTNIISVSDGGVWNGSDLVSWNGIVVQPGSPRKLYVSVSVDPYAKPDLLLVAEAASEGEVATDTTKVVEAEIMKALPHLQVSISDGLTFVQPAEDIHYQILVHNPSQEPRTYTLRAEIPTDTTVTGVDGEHKLSRQAVEWIDQEILPGDTREYRFAVRVAEDVEEFYMIRTRASIASQSDIDTTSVHTGVAPGALVVSTSDGLSSTVPGSIVTYDVLVRNQGNRLATEVDVNNALPQYMEYVSSTEGGQWVGKNVRWTGLTVSPYGERHLRVTGRVRSDAPLGAELRNTVLVEGFEAADRTSVSRKVSGQGVAMDRADVLISKTADRSEVRPGDTARFTVTVQNVTDAPLYNVHVEDRMDSPYVSVESAESGQIVDNRIVWDIPMIAPGEMWTVGYNATVSPYAPHGVSIPNIVTVSGEGIQTLSLEERISTSSLGVVSNLPPTGAAFDALFLGLSGMICAAQTVWQRRRRV